MLSKVAAEEDRLANDLQARSIVHVALNRTIKQVGRLAHKEEIISSTIEELEAQSGIAKDATGIQSLEEWKTQIVSNELLQDSVRQELCMREVKINKKIREDRADLKRARQLEDVEAEVLGSNVLDF